MLIYELILPMIIKDKFEDNYMFY